MIKEKKIVVVLSLATLYYLIESRENVIGELNLGNSSRSHGSKTDTESSNTLLRQGGVEDAITA
jgi:hypothetical protein